MDSRAAIGKKHFREFTIDRARLNKDKRTVELAFSSEEPYERWWGIEILDHTPGAADLRRLNDGAALLVNHDVNDLVGVVEKAWFDPDKKGRAAARFGKSARAEEILTDVEDEIRTKVSFAYQIDEMREETPPNADRDTLPTFRVTKWTPLEISIVAIPADATVGIGRSMETKNMNEASTQTRAADSAPANATAQPTDLNTIRAEILNEERTRIREIEEIVGRHANTFPRARALADECIRDGLPLREFQAKLLSERSNAQRDNAGAPTPVPVGPIGMSQQDCQRFSIVKAVRECTSRGGLQGLEREASDAYAKQVKKDAQTFWVPPDVLLRGGGWGGVQQRDQLAATGTLGGNLVADILLAGSFIDILRSRMVVARLGAGMLPGLEGDILIPRQSGSGTAGWAASEAAATVESSLTFDQVSMTPKSCTAWVQYSRQLMIQSTPAIEALVRSDLTAQIARAIDLAAIAGPGTAGQPTGILSTSGIGVVTLGANGLALNSTVTWPLICDLEQELGVDSADFGSLAYATNPKVRGDLKQIEKAPSSGAQFCWQDLPNIPAAGEGILNGYRALSSTQIPSNLTAGTSTTIASALIFGNWADVLVGMWGGLDVLVDPYTNGSVRLVNLYATEFVDVGIRHPQSFAACTQILA